MRQSVNFSQPLRFGSVTLYETEKGSPAYQITADGLGDVWQHFQVPGTTEFKELCLASNLPEVANLSNPNNPDLQALLTPSKANEQEIRKEFLLRILNSLITYIRQSANRLPNLKKALLLSPPNRTRKFQVALIEWEQELIPTLTARIQNIKKGKVLKQRSEDPKCLTLINPDARNIDVINVTGPAITLTPHAAGIKP